MVVLMAASGSQAQDRGRDPSKPIIFTSPNKDTISTNLHQVNRKESPFKNLEEEIRNPFEIFDKGPPTPRIAPPRQISAPNPSANNNSLKAILEKSAEEQFLKGENSGQEDQNDPFKSPEKPLGLFNDKPKTSLERYYDRLEKDQIGRTNNSSTTDLFGRRNARTSDEKTGLEASPANQFSGMEQPSYLRPSVKNPDAGSSFKKEFTAEKSLFGDRAAEMNPTGPFDRATKQSEARMENFKKLLDGSANSKPRNNNNLKPVPYGNTAPATTRPDNLSATPTWSQSKPAAGLDDSRRAFTKSAGMVGSAGKPKGIQDYGSSDAASLSTPIAPIQPTKRVRPTYNPPTGR